MLSRPLLNNLYVIQLRIKKVFKIMYNRHFRAPLTFESGRFFRGRKVSKKFKISALVISTILKIIYIFTLMAIDLVLFTDSGNLNIYGGEYFLSPELLGLLGFLLAISSVIMILASFSQWAQNIICALVTGWFVSVLFNQFAQFDYNSFLGDYLRSFLGSAPGFLYSYSSTIIAVILALLVLWFLFSANLIFLSVYVLLFMIAFAGILRQGFNNSRNQHDFIELYQSQIKNNADEHGEKFVYIMLPNLPSYKYFSTQAATEAKDTGKLMTGFYAKNNFEVFGNAYIQDDNYFMNMVRSVNLFSDDAPQKHIMDTMMLYKYWKFFNVNDEYIFLKDNQMFDTFRKAGYKISAYKSRGFDLCHKNHMFNVDRCIEKLNRPINLYSMNMSQFDRSQMLLLEWFSSMKLFSDMSTVYQFLRIFGEPDNMPLVGINYNNLYVINSIETFKVLGDNIIADKGRQAYFVYADIPSDMFIYDEFCQIKPRHEWINMENMPWVKADNTLLKQRAYYDQTKCLFGKLQEFLDRLDKEKLLDKAVIIVEGMSSINNFKSKAYENFVDDFVYGKLVTLAVKSPVNKTSVFQNDICESDSIVRHYLYKDKVCEGLNGINIHQSLKDDLVNRLSLLDVSEAQLKDDVEIFDDWYARWYTINNMKLLDPVDVIKKGHQAEQVNTHNSDTPDLQNETLQLNKALP